MHSVKLITVSKTSLLVLLLLVSSFIRAQDNSPYSRYGLGDAVPNQNILSRGMGGISAGLFDRQSLNLVNPAALSSIGSVVFDFGGEVDLRTLKSNLTPEKFTSANTTISYMQLGLPLSSPKMMAKGKSWALSLGLRPSTRVAYKISDNKRIPNIDSANTTYEGSGGVSQFTLSTALRLKNFSIGITGGYNFGNRVYSTKRYIINDSLYYFAANKQSDIDFGGIFITAGIQYGIKMNGGADLRLGAYTNFGQSMNAKRSSLLETFIDDGDGGIIPVDTVSYVPREEGKIKMPATYGFGFTYADSSNHWLFGADYETTKGSDYRIFGQKDNIVNSYKVRMGVQYFPANRNTQASKYFSFVKYRAGFYFGTEPVKVDKQINQYAVSIGAGFPLTSLQMLRYGEYALLNAAIEAGGRGTKSTGSIRESFLRFNVGVSMTARWFQKRKYD
ncbi:MAG: hypothetical protein JSR00_09955 [Bacteroidetes bacterium]|nr:hypothetical protein [Bacteroidota bacterium]